MLNLIIRKRLLLFTVLIVTSAVIGAKFLTAFPSIPSPAKNTRESLTWGIKLDNPYVMQGSTDDILVNLTIKGKEVIVDENIPLNIVLVLDGSGSMSEKGKMDYAKSAASQIIDNLSDKDRLGIVVYSSGVNTLLPIDFLGNKSHAKNLINSIYPTNSTNLYGGLAEGINQLSKVLSGEYINRVVLLSDGLANAGITDMDRIIDLSRKASKNGITLTTMGLGASYDENMLTNIADYGAGNYYFIESPAQIASIFSKEFNKMINTVAKNPKIKLELSDDVTIKEVYGYKYSQFNNGVEINPGDITSGQTRSLLISLKVPSNQLGEKPLLRASMEFDDLINKSFVVTDAIDMDYQVTENKQIYLSNQNKEVDAKGISISAATELYRAANEYEQGRRHDALDRIKSSLNDIVRLNSSTMASRATIAQEEALREAYDDIKNNAPEPSSEAGKNLVKKYKAESREQQK